MHDLLPHVGPRQAYAEVYFTHTTASAAVGFSEVMCGTRKPGSGNAVELSAAAIRSRVAGVSGADVRLDPTAVPIYVDAYANPHGASTNGPLSAADIDARCIVTAIVKTPLGIRTSSHLEFLRSRTTDPLITSDNGLALTRATSGTQYGMPSKVADFSTRWSGHARRIAIGQHTYLNLLSFFQHAAPSRTTGGSGSLLEYEVTSKHEGLAGIDDSIRVLDRTDPEFDHVAVPGHDIVADMDLAQAPTIATALMVSSHELVSDEANRKSTYTVTRPW